MENKLLRACYFGTYREDYSRNQIMIAGLRSNGVSVVECHEQLWHGVEDRVNTVSGGWLRPKFIVRAVRAYWRLLMKYVKMNDYDILILGYPGQLDVFLARILSWIKHRPLVWDVFMSIYLISVERGIGEHHPNNVKLLHFLESMALRLPNLLIQDTAEYVKWFHNTYKIDKSRFRLVPTGADDRFFTPPDDKVKKNGDFRVMYAGTFIPNHGVIYILEAAKRLSNHTDIRFELIGRGPDLEAAKSFVSLNQLHNVTFFEWMERTELSKYIQHADVCLGAFGRTPQSLMTVQNKIYETMAMKKPLISGDSEAIRQVCTHEENIYLCNRADGASLAEAILSLKMNPDLCEKIAQNGYTLFKEKYDIEHIGKLFKQHLAELL